MGPLAQGRGLPPDISDRAKSDYEAAIAAAPDEFFGTTWNTWAEIAAVDWKAPYGHVVLEYRPEKESAFTWPTEQSAFREGIPADFIGSLDEVSRFVGPFPPGFAGQGHDLKPGQRWEAKGRKYAVVSATRENLLGANWVLLFDIMALLAARLGSENVRLTVWFDQ